MLSYAVLVALNILLLCAIPFMPSTYSRLTTSVNGGLPSGRGCVALLAVVARMAAIMSLWLYVLPLARAAGMSEQAAGFALSLSLACQILGGLYTAVFANRVNPIVMLLVGFAVNIVAVSLIVVGQSRGLFVIALSLVGFLWMGVTPYKCLI
jgi:hypothetical protein